MLESLTREPEASLRSETFSRLLEELGALLETSSPPATFYAEFLRHLMSAISISGAAIWTRTPSGGFDLEHAIHWPALRLEATPDGIACHAQVLQVASERKRALWVAPQSGSKLVGDISQAANRSDHGLLLAPVIVEMKVVGLLEVWVHPAPEVPNRRELARLLTELGGFLAAFYHKRQGQSLLQEQQLRRHLDTFVRQIHSSLDPKIVAQWIAQEGRCFLECDQLNVALRSGPNTKVAAVSGAAVVEANSRTVESLRTLCDAVMTWGEILTYDGSRDETLPIAVVNALDAYLSESNSRMLIVLPVKTPQTGGESGRAIAALAAESFEPTFSANQLNQRLQLLAVHATSALKNAIELDRMPLRQISRSLAGLRDWAKAKTIRRLSLYVLPFVLLIGALTIVPTTLRLEAKGQLLPVQRQMIYAAHTGKIIELRVHPGDRVEKGQEILYIEDLESQLQIDQLAIKIGTAEQRLALLSDQLGKKTSNEERSVLAKESVQQQYELRKATVERDILLQTSRSPRKAPVFAPFAGKVVTFDAYEQLLGKTVKTGDPLVRIAGVKGTWEIELLIPERNVGAIKEALLTNEAGFVEVDLLLASQPQRTYKARLYKDGLAGETKVVENSVVLPARVRIFDDDLIRNIEEMPVGLEVRSKIHCGRKSVGAVWFHDLWEFFYEHVVF